MLKSLFAIAIYFLSTAAHAEWKVSAVQGAVTVQKAPLTKGKVFSGSWNISASPSSTVTLSQGADRWTLSFARKTSLQLSSFSEGLAARLESGEIGARSGNKNTAPFVVEWAGWQLQKNNGHFKVRRLKEDAVVNNIDESLWVKPAELSGAPQEVVGGLRFKIQNNQQIFGFENTYRPGTPVRWAWDSTPRQPASAQKDANSMCSSPSAGFEQCAWKCLGQRNPRSKSCDTGFSHVHCLRLMCAADGQWKWPTLVPGDACSAHDVRVDSCK